MKRKTLWITETAVMLAALIALQAITKPLGQFVTGSCVNAVLGITVLVAGISSGVTVALLSPVFAYLLGIAPQILTVPAIMVGNLVFVLILGFLLRKDAVPAWKRIAAWLLAAIAKFAVLYALVVGIICGVAADALLAQGTLKQAMLQALPATFSWPQLVTALIGGAVAIVVSPLLNRALKKNQTRR